MSLKWNVNQNGMSIKIECHLEGNFGQIEMSFKLNVTQNNKISPKIKYQLK